MGSIKVRVLAFATASDALGAAETELELPSAASVAGLRRVLLERYPALVPLGTRLAIAVDGELARDDTPLRDGAEVALLPPVSGG
jgi:molybdopterin converting factor subunit 1